MRLSFSDPINSRTYKVQVEDYELRFLPDIPLRVAEGPSAHGSQELAAIRCRSGVGSALTDVPVIGLCIGEYKLPLETPQEIHFNTGPFAQGTWRIRATRVAV